MILFFVHHLDETAAFLEEDEFQHCIKVLRNKLGDHIYVTDGKGLFAEARIETILKRKAALSILKIQKPDKKPNISFLAVAPPKSKSRWEFILEKAVEAGVDVIIPFESSHSERVKINRERAEKIMRSAALQSKRVLHPYLKEMISFSEVLQMASDINAEGLLAHYNAAHAHINDIEFKTTSQLILIGPEGDFSTEEYDQAINHGFTAVNISRHRLRTETAALAAICLLEGRHQAPS